MSHLLMIGGIVPSTLILEIFRHWLNIHAILFRDLKFVRQKHIELSDTWINGENITGCY